MRGLLDAVMSLGHGLELPQVLHGIVEAAVTLTDAEYGALGIVGDERTLSEFLPVGMSEELAARIGRTPCGRGILGELIHNPAPLRLTDLTRHPRSYGFPEHHPPMRTFLGVPVRVREEVFGNLYLTEKRGGAAFDADDEAVLTTLSIAAGVAIDNARMYHESRRRERWLQALGEITRSLLSGTDADEALKLIAARAKEVAGADGAVVVPAAVDGEGTGAGPGDGPAVVVPLPSGPGACGALRLHRRAGRPPFDDTEVKLISGFADQAAIALELAQRRAESEELAVLHDRDRIARDLHDLAIQRLFATGMTLQSATRLIERPEAAERVGRAVDDLDTTIQIIRSTIFGLRTAGDGRGSGPSLRRDMAEAVQAAARMLGFAPALRIEGRADTDVPGELAEQVLAVAVEALSNAARHAAARRVDVVLAVDGSRATLTVTDDGVGVGSAPRRGGLANMRSRAELHGGSLSVETPEGGGTRIVWTVPLPD
ncbi:histidine kinase [Streptomyces hiroshimensis]|uniref:Histidine kinase n=1 Tax=Streptomyces hiroshimensis TaxID=66424 RepID=A0ABQ2YTX7_9ACTN|nr:GAF domain-containing protein [Streptomyces hiroshimensis]GGX93518.1 histidine kinase [Streptomyces hiroshimensis]